MRELAVVGLLLGLVALSGAVAWIPWRSLAVFGVGAVIAGAAIGLPTGVVYHVLLHRALGRQGGVPRDWLWRPIELIRGLDAPARRPIWIWTGISGFGFVVIVVGLAAVVGSMAGAWVQGP